MRDDLIQNIRDLNNTLNLSLYQSYHEHWAFLLTDFNGFMNQTELIEIELIVNTTIS